MMKVEGLKGAMLIWVTGESGWVVSRLGVLMSAWIITNNKLQCLNQLWYAKLHCFPHRPPFKESTKIIMRFLSYLWYYFNRWKEKVISVFMWTQFKWAVEKGHLCHLRSTLVLQEPKGKRFHEFLVFLWWLQLWIWVFTIQWAMEGNRICIPDCRICRREGGGWIERNKGGAGRLSFTSSFYRHLVILEDLKVRAMELNI